MIKLNKAFANFSQAQMEDALDVPVWISLLAAYDNDGKIDPSEKAEAIRFSFLRSFTAHPDIREYAVQVYKRFEKRFDELNNSLPENLEDKIEYIRSKVRDGIALTRSVESSIAEEMIVNAERYYRHVFRAGLPFVHYFVLPVVSNDLQKSLSERLGESDTPKD